MRYRHGHKYTRRYEREVNCKQHSTMKRILEEDMPANKTMVLRVCSILPPQAAAGDLTGTCWMSFSGVLDISCQGRRQQAVPCSAALPPCMLSMHAEPECCSSRCLRCRQWHCIDQSGDAGLGSMRPAAGMLPRLVELTDGWYRVRAALDQPLGAAMDRGQLQIGVHETCVHMCRAVIRSGSASGGSQPVRCQCQTCHKRADGIV